MHKAARLHSCRGWASAETNMVEVNKQKSIQQRNYVRNQDSPPSLLFISLAAATPVKSTQVSEDITSANGFFERAAELKGVEISNFAACDKGVKCGRTNVTRKDIFNSIIWGTQLGSKHEHRKNTDIERHGEHKEHPHKYVNHGKFEWVNGDKACDAHEHRF
ncbi:hypothetical protein K470DRAFT_294365 [Piedraia hortae CBS 480.64]|uniref:Uncharacterized protein n=1 Tax=Piedraia hortae CBS 480.64 TaxID=1314780 RepID=A0A6A7C1M3_9PEZI|nr:hypothetical protein K470DRAFT_294365 [Piedraia hortae CBS 480.64]